MIKNQLNYQCPEEGQQGESGEKDTDEQGRPPGTHR